MQKTLALVALFVLATTSQPRAAVGAPVVVARPIVVARPAPVVAKPAPTVAQAHAERVAPSPILPTPRASTYTGTPAARPASSPCNRP